ncbi:MAG: hypothetical protein PHX45_00080 [Acidobacteriota bacterium]|nr:hypothetical protein [Acidobacteriota bacterium]
MNIIDALHNRAIFGPLLKKAETWHAWEIYLRGLFNIPILAEKDRKLFKTSTGLTKPRAERIRESFVICGRRSGKSYMSALIASYLAGFKDWKPYLSPGEKGWIFIVANDKAQAGIIKAYISGIFQRVKCLKPLVEKETVETLELKNGINVAVKTASFRAIRGYTILAAILEEIAFWRSEESANPDKEILAAVRPALATIPESLLLGISTPYNRSGVLWEQFKLNFGKMGGPLIWKASTRTMNPTIDESLIENALKEDPAAAGAEWSAEWRQDIEAFIPPELVEAAMVPGRFELPRLEGVQYYAFADPSGGRQDSFTLGISHRESSGKIILDCLRERRPAFQPKSVVSEFSELMKSFGLSEVVADRYAGEWVTSAFGEFGIMVRPSELSASEIYLNFLPLISNGTVELLDNKRLTGQLTGLERRTRGGGKDLVTHYIGGHDDLANAAAGVCVLAQAPTCEPRIRRLGTAGKRFEPAFKAGRISLM